MDDPASPPLSHRYGGGPARASRVRVLVPALLLVIATAWALWAGFSGNRHEITWQVDRFDTQPAQVVISFTLHRPADVPVTCTFRARGRDGAVVGTGDLTLPPSKRSTVSSVYTLATSATPVTGEIETCRRASAR